MWFLIYTKFPKNCYVICLYLFTKVGFYPFLGGIVWLTLLDWAQASVATLKEVPDGFFLFQSCFYPKWQLLTNGLNKSWFTSPCIYTWIKLCISNTILFDIFYYNYRLFLQGKVNSKLVLKEVGKQGK